MINRELIRLKVVQIVYSYYQNGNQNNDKSKEDPEMKLKKEL